MWLGDTAGQRGCRGRRAIEVDCDPARAEDDRYVEARYDEVCASIQSGMDALARLRRLPLFG